MSKSLVAAAGARGTVVTAAESTLVVDGCALASTGNDCIAAATTPLLLLPSSSSSLSLRRALNMVDLAPPVYMIED